MAPGSLRPELGKERSFELDETLKFLKIKKKKKVLLLYGKTTYSTNCEFLKAKNKFLFLVICRRTCATWHNALHITYKQIFKWKKMTFQGL